MVARIKGDQDGKYFFGYARNISEQGLFIASINPRPLGEIFTIDFFIKELKLHVRCQAEVIWNREYQPKSPHEAGMGIRFIDIDEQTKSQIGAWIDHAAV